MSGKTLTNAKVRLALERIQQKLSARNTKGEICILGGAAMMLAFHARQATKDVDAIFAPTSVMREIAGEVARELELPEHWLNDGVKGFLSKHHVTDASKNEESSHLRITFPTAEYLLAMKCMASRLSYGDEEHTDKDDIKFLIRKTGYKTAEEVLTNVEKFYARELIQPKTQFLVETILAEIESENERA